MEQAVIGVDIGGTNIEFAAVTRDGQVLKSFTYRTKEFITVESFAQKLKDQIEWLRSKYEILGIGIGAPTANYFTGKIEYAPNLPWRGIVPLQKIVEQITGLKTKITNDANAVAHAELKYGGGKGLNHFIVITLGTGVGSGIVVNGKVLYGSHGLAGEFGHTQVYPDGRKCSCGRKGCLETYVSIRGIMRTFQEYGGSSEGLTPKDVYNLAIQGDIIAQKTYSDTAKILGMQLADLVHLFDPQVIFLYGGIAKAHKIIIPTAQEELDKHLLQAFKHNVEILPSPLLNNRGAVLGAAALIWENI